MPDKDADTSKLTDSDEPFDQALIAAANEIREGSNLDPSHDLTEAAIMVLDQILSVTLEGAGREHKPHPTYATTETASRAACFMAACLTGLFINLKKEDIQLDIPAVYTRAGFTVFQWYTPEQQAALLASGQDMYKKLLAAASDYPNVWEWIDDVQSLTAAYVLTRDGKYITLLRKAYLSLWQATEKGLDTREGK